jgi:aminomethyltransferase
MGDTVWDGDQKIGVITCGMYSPLTNTSVALARVDVPYAVEDRPVQIKGSLEVDAITHTLPFDDPQKLKRTAKG